QVRYQHGGFDPVTGDGMMEARIRAAVDAEEVAKLKKRVRRKAEELASAGKIGGGGTRPFGYEEDRKTIRKSEAKLIRAAVDRVIGGESYFAVLRDWNERGIQSPAGLPWKLGTFKNMLLSPRIAGLRQHGRDEDGRAIVV